LNLNSKLELKNAFAGVYAGKRVLVTGHTGFKGSWLCEWLLALGAEVTGFALPPPTVPSLFDQLGLASRLRHVIGDVRDLAAVRQVVEQTKPDFVFHLAAQPLVRLSYEQPVETYATNVMGTVNVLEALRAYQNEFKNDSSSSRPVTGSEPGTGDSVHGSSSSSGPIFEPGTGTGNLNSLGGLPRSCVAVMVTTDKCYENKEWVHSYREEDPMGGYDPYSSSKGAAELVISAYRRSFFSSWTSNLDLDSERVRVLVASARAGNVIGGGDWALDRIVPDCIRSLQRGEAIPVRNKVATRPWQHVLEPLSGYLWLGASLAKEVQVGSPSPSRTLQSPGSQQEKALDLDLRPGRLQALCSAFNFGPSLSSNRTVAELVQEILKHLPGKWDDKSDPKAVHEAKLLNLATDKAHHFIGWSPAWSFSETVRETVEWYRNAEGVGVDFRALTLGQIAAYTASARATSVAWAAE